MVEAATQDSVYGLSGDWAAGAANGSYNAVWGARHNAQNRAGRFALSPAEHVEELIDHHLAGLNKNPSSKAAPAIPPSIEGHEPGYSFLDLGPDDLSNYVFRVLRPSDS
jgi:hypothetical protein